MRNITLGALLVAAIAACTSPGYPVGPSGAPSGRLAVIDGEPVPMAGYQRWLVDAYGRRTQDEYIRLWLFEREAKRLGIVVTEVEIEAALQELWADWIRDRLGGDASALDAHLEKQGHDRASFRRWFHWEKRRELLSARLIQAERKIEEPDLVRRFEQLYGPNGVRTQVRVLVLTRARLLQELRQKPGARVLTAAELDQLLLERAEALRARALGGESFETIVRAESTDLAVRKTGGVCGDEEWRLRGAAFVRAVEAAELNVVQPPVPNSSGIDVFEVVSRETTRLEDVRSKLTAELLTAPPSLEELAALEQRLRAASKIEFE